VARSALLAISSMFRRRTREAMSCATHTTTVKLSGIASKAASPTIAPTAAVGPRMARAPPLEPIRTTDARNSQTRTRVLMAWPGSPSSK
jgi:hypothetical protein